MSEPYMANTLYALPKDWGISKVLLTDECIEKLATKIAFAIGVVLFGKRDKAQMDEMETVVNCNLRENAELIAKILDADANGEVWKGEEDESNRTS